MRCLHCQRDGLTWSTHSCPHCGVSLRALLSDMLVPRTVLRGTYEIDFPIGRGAFGITYQARHNTLGQVVAVKEFYPREHANRHGVECNVAATPDQADVFARNLQRFVEQGRSLAQLSHPNVVRVFDMFKERGTAYLVMELVDGATLRGVMLRDRSRTLPVDEVESITSQLVGALEAVHEHRIYHLDIKPENILVEPGGRVVLVDFGAARQGFSRMSTQAYTVQYAAPEVVAGDDVGPDSDLFELGVLVHEMLTGERPPCALERLLKKNDFVPDSLPEPWRHLVQNAIRMKRSDRPPTVTAWWQSRAKATPAPPPIAKPTPLPVAVAPTPSQAPARVVPAEVSGPSSLAEAIDGAADGAVLRLAGGRHRITTPLVISRAIVMRGAETERTEIEFAGKGTAVLFEGRGPWRVEGVVFRRLHDEGGHLVEVRGGDIHFEGCGFTGAHGTVGTVPAAGLRLLGRTRGVVNSCESRANAVGFAATDKAWVTLEDCQAIDNEHAGIAFEGFAEGTARGNDAAGNRGSGVLVGGDAKPILEANRCAANKLAGIMYVDHGGGKAWYNECTSNDLHGIYVSESGGTVLDSNQCVRNGWAGIAYAGSAGGSARANECSENAEFGILAADRAGPALEENCCQANGKSGLAYVDAATGNCRANQLLQNGRHGLAVNDRCVVHAVDNVIVGNKGCGVAFAGNAGGVVKQNRIKESGESGISLSDDASPLIEQNEISANAMAGLLVRGRSQARSLRNHMLSNLYGVYVDEDASPTVEGCMCSDNKASGLGFFGRARGVARENELEGNVHGVYLDDRSAVLIERNRCVGNRESGVTWFGASAGEARDNEFAANDVYGMCVTEQASPEIAGNRCHRNKGSGLHVQGDSQCRVEQNSFVRNGQNGIDVHGQAQPVLDSNTCMENARAGVVFGGSASGRATSNICQQNAGSGIEVRDGAFPHLTRNRAAQNGVNGITYSGLSVGVAHENAAVSNGQHGIMLTDRAEPHLLANECDANKECGIAWYGSAAGLAERNQCTMNELHGILVCEQALPRLDHNECAANLAIDVMAPMVRPGPSPP